MPTKPLMRLTRPLVAAAAVCAVIAGTSPASAQLVDFELVPHQGAPGVVLTPMATVGVIYDDNATLVAETDPKRSDTVLLVRPGLELALNRKHTVLAASYFGSLMRYRTLEQINSYDQVGRVEFRHQATKRLQLFAQNVFSVNSSTDAVPEPDVVFVRTGTRRDTLDGGATFALTQYLHMNAQYHFQWLDFDPTFQNDFLRGGQSHGVTVDLRRQMSPRWTLGGSYDLRHSIVADAPATSNIQNVQGVVEWQIAPTLKLQGGAGISLISLEDEIGSQTAPAGHIAIEKRTEYASFTASAAQSYRASFGSGRNTSNRQLLVGVHVPIFARRAYVSGQFLRYRNEPAIGEGLASTSNWLRVALGYSVARFARLEGYFAGGYQKTSAQGNIQRNRIGVQISTSAPMRID